jgi:hypothetical protein
VFNSEVFNKCIQRAKEEIGIIYTPMDNGWIHVHRSSCAEILAYAVYLFDKETK